MALRSLQVVAESCVLRGPLRTWNELASGRFDYKTVRAPNLLWRLLLFGPGSVVLASVAVVRLFVAVAWGALIAFLFAVLADWALDKGDWQPYAVAGFATVLIVVLGVLDWMMVLVWTKSRVAGALERWGLEDRAFIFAVTLGLPVVLFAALAAALVDVGWMQLRAPDDPNTVPAQATVANCVETFAWLLAGTVPMLELPDTFE